MKVNVALPVRIMSGQSPAKLLFRRFLAKADMAINSLKKYVAAAIKVNKAIHTYGSTTSGQQSEPYPLLCEP